MSVWQFRQKLKKEKSYLQRLEKSPDVEHTHSILQNSSQRQLKLLVKFLHFLSNGDIPLRKEYRRSFQKKKVHSVFEHYFFVSTATNKNLHNLLNSSKENLLHVLTQIQHILPKALYFVFHKVQ